MRIRTKLWLTMVALIAGYLATVVIVSLLSLRAEQGLAAVAQSMYPASLKAKHAIDAFSAQASAFEDIVLSGDQDQLPISKSQAAEVASALNDLRSLASKHQAEEASAIAELNEAYTRQGLITYPALAKDPGNEALRLTAAGLYADAQVLRERLERLGQSCSESIRSELDRERGSARTLRIMSQVVFTAVATISILIALYVLALLTRRLQTLLHASERMSLGDFTSVVDDRSSDEIGKLSQSFVTMRQAVQDRDFELRHFNEALEKTVSERTAEVTRKNQDLLTEFAERERAQLSLRLLESAVSQIDEAVIISTPHGATAEAEILYANPTFARTFAGDGGEVVGRTMRSLTATLEEEALAHILEEASAGENAMGEIVDKRQQGEGAIEWRASPIRDASGRVTHVVSILHDITQRKRAEAVLEDTNRRLVDASRQAGQAEVATGVLHNVGNVLNSINVSASIVAGTLQQSKLDGLAKAVALLEEHRADLADFLARDDRGRRIPEYLAKLARILSDERRTLVGEVEGLARNIDHVKDIIGMQQAYARNSSVLLLVSAQDLMEDALRMQGEALARHQIEVARDYQDLPPLLIDKHRILQILINLVTNAKHAMDPIPAASRRLAVSVFRRADVLGMTVTDSGVGIADDKLARIFEHGFTTKADGHGFGLHSSALAAKEMKGQLIVRSDGLGYGASFTLEIPV